MPTKTDVVSGGLATQLYINGEWRDASTGDKFDVLDPTTGESFATVSSASVEDALDAVSSAANALPAWAATSPRERAELLRRAFEIMMKRERKLAELIVRENGKSMPDAVGEVRYAADFFRWYSEEAVRAIGEI